MKYKLRLLKGNMSIRKDHGTQKDGKDIDKIATLTATTTHLGDVVWPCLVDGEDEYLDAKAGDSWLHLTVPREGWVAIQHNGEELCELIEVPDETPVGKFPDKFVLTDPATGESVDYVRVQS